MKVVSIVGARPQFVKAAALSRVLRKSHSEILVHTGQHYDENMSDVFFRELAIPAPDYNLEVGSGLHGRQTGAMLAGIEDVLLKEKPDWVLIYGDTNSTLAGALAAAKLHIPIAHVEAGLRSFNRCMPEEINRIIADQLSALLFCPCELAMRNAGAEGITRGVHVVGDVMYDALLFYKERCANFNERRAKYGVLPGRYLLATVHRAENTDDDVRLVNIVNAFGELARAEDVLFPVHPRTRTRLQKLASRLPALNQPRLKLLDPIGYLDMLALESEARLILTDSGGMQKEAYWMRVPCVTLRDETEWIELVESGWNRRVGAVPSAILAAVRDFALPARRDEFYGDGQTAQCCVELMESC